MKVATTILSITTIASLLCGSAEALPSLSPGSILSATTTSSSITTVRHHGRHLGHRSFFGFGFYGRHRRRHRDDGASSFKTQPAAGPSERGEGGGAPSVTPNDSKGPAAPSSSYHY
jgi:hypothetical protein